MVGPNLAELRRRIGCLALSCFSCGAAGGAVHIERAPVDGNTADFFRPSDIEALPPSQRLEWERYLAGSAKIGAIDRASMEVELASRGRVAMTPAPFRKAFRLEARMTEAWFHDLEAQDMADAMLSFQTPSGGWSKHVEYGVGPRQKGQSYYSENTRWQYIATIDNDSTTEQLKFLAATYVARSEPRYRDAFLRGIDYLFAAQYPNGCWPQVFPLQGGYHDAATYNDDATVNVLRLLGDVARGRWQFVTPALERESAERVLRGLRCIVDSQVVIAGLRTVWAQQHHPTTLAPVSARSYELIALAGRESSNLTSYLMELPNPSAEVMEAVHAAARWFDKHRITGFEYGKDQVLRPVEGAGPIWARLYEMGTDRPIFSNRDGVKRYDWNELTDRRRGYSWFGKEPAAMLERYAVWSTEHPSRLP